MAQIRPSPELARRLLYIEQLQFEGKTMFDRKFFQSKLGRTAMLSIAAMLAMNVVALNAQLGAVSGTYAAAPAQVELA